MPALVEAIMTFHISAVMTGGIMRGMSIMARSTPRPTIRLLSRSATASPKPTCTTTAASV